MMTRTKRAISAATVMLCALAAWQVRAAGPAVLEQVPDDAQVSVVVKDLKGLSNKVNNAATRMGIPGVPADLLKEVQKQLGLGKGFDEKGSAALVLLGTGEAKEGEEAAPAGIAPPMVLLVPATDAKALLAQYKPEAAGGGISKVTMPTENEQPGYAATVGSFVALAEQKETLVKFLAKKGSLDKKLTPDLAKAFEVNDLVVYANVPTFAKQGIKAIDDFKGMMGMMMAMGGGGANEANMAAATAMLDMYFEGAKQLLTDGQVGLLTARLDDAGVTLGFAGHFMAESKIGKSVAAAKPLASPALDGLPAGKVLAAGVATWEPGSFMEFVGKIQDALMASPALAADEKLAAKMKRAVEIQKQGLALMTGTKFAFYEPADTTQGWVKGTMLFDVTDPAKYQTLMTQAIKENLMDMAMVGPAMKIDTTVTENALTVKGVSLTKIAMKFAVKETPDAPASANDREAVEVIKKIYGPNGAVMYLGVVGKQALTVIGDEKAAEASVVAAQTALPALSNTPEIAAAAKGVVERPIAVMYLPVDRWIDLAKREMGMGGATKPTAGAVALGNAPSPMLVSVGVKGAVVTAELHMPMSALIHIADTAKAMEGAGGPRFVPDEPVPAPAQ